MDWMGMVVEFRLHVRERRRVVVVAVDVPQLRHQRREGVPILAAAVFDDRPSGTLDELIPVPRGFGDADDQEVEPAAAGHGLKRREDLLVRQVAGRPEEHERVRARSGHGLARPDFLDVAAEREAHRRQHLVLEEIHVA
jgi:hypothetical protein